jgi:phage gp45-like
VTGIRELAAKVRNLFCEAELQKRDGDGTVQIRTRNGKVLEKAEAFPYGFCARAKSGKALVFCQGGNFDGFEILPVMKAGDVAAPELEAGDAALYTGNGGYVIVRESGDAEVCAKGDGKVLVKTEKGVFAVKNDGKIYLGNGQADFYALFAGLIDEIKGIVTSGSSASQTVNPVTQQKLELYKNRVKELFAEAE